MHVDLLPPRPAALDVRVGGGVAGRSFWYTDDLFSALRPYYLPIAASVGGALEWYPGAHFTAGPGSWFGVIGGGQYLFANSTDAQGRPYTTRAFDAYGGVRVRFPWRFLDPGVSVSYVYQGFSIDRSAVSLAPPSGLFSVAWQSLRLGLSLRAQLHPRVSLYAAGAYLVVLSSGELGSQQALSRLSAGGADATLGVGIHLVAGLEARVEASWRRYFFSANARPGDSYVAGGGVDDNYGATVSLAWRR